MSGGFVVRVDEKGRIVLPAEVRRALGVRAGDRVVVVVRGDGVAEVYPLARLLERVRRVFEEKLRGWREEEHEASKLLARLVVGRSGGGDS